MEARGVFGACSIASTQSQYTDVVRQLEMHADFR